MVRLRVRVGGWLEIGWGRVRLRSGCGLGFELGLVSRSG